MQPYFDFLLSTARSKNQRCRWSVVKCAQVLTVDATSRWTATSGFWYSQNQSWFQQGKHLWLFLASFSIKGITWKRNLSNFFGVMDFFSPKDVWLSDNLGPIPCSPGLVNLLCLESIFSFGCGLATSGGLPTGIEYAIQWDSRISIPVILIFKSTLINLIFGYTGLTRGCSVETSPPLMDCWVRFVNCQGWDSVLRHCLSSKALNGGTLVSWLQVQALELVAQLHYCDISFSVSQFPHL